MDEVWRRIEKWLDANSPAALAGLNPPASAQELADAEQSLGVRLPEDVRASYFRHDGQSRDSPWMLEGWQWLPLRGTQEVWRFRKGLLDKGTFAGWRSDHGDPAVRDDWWHPGWAPLTDSGANDHHCVDLAPGPKGASGQIVKFWNQEGAAPLFAASFRDWLRDIAEGMARGEFVASDRYRVVCRRRELAGE